MKTVHFCLHIWTQWEKSNEKRKTRKTTHTAGIDALLATTSVSFLRATAGCSRQCRIMGNPQHHLPKNNRRRGKMQTKHSASTVGDDVFYAFAMHRIQPAYALLLIDFFYCFQVLYGRFLEKRSLRTTQILQHCLIQLHREAEEKRGRVVQSITVTHFCKLKYN